MAELPLIIMNFSILKATAKRELVNKPASMSYKWLLLVMNMVRHKAAAKRRELGFSITRVTRLGEISPFGQFFMAKFFLEKIAQ